MSVVRQSPAIVRQEEGGGRRSVTHDLAALKSDIEESWQVLSPALKQDIQQVFDVDVTESSVRVSLR